MPAAARDEFSAASLVTEILHGFASHEQLRILRWIAEKLGHGMQGKRLPDANPNRTGTDSADVHAGFLAAHAPANDMHFAAAVAYALQRFAPVGFRKDAITAEDVREAASKAARKGPKFPGQTLINAQEIGFFEKVGFGRYALTSKGAKAVDLVTQLGVNGAGAHGSRKGIKIAPKFVNPRDLMETWSGRGRQPVWVRTALARGARLDESAFRNVRPTWRMAMILA